MTTITGTLEFYYTYFFIPFTNIGSINYQV